MDDLELLCRHAWLLMEWRNAIRSNGDWSRIAVNIMAATLPRATIGAYLDFWEGEGCVECSHESNAVNEGVMVGTLGLVCNISCNPDTGNNCYLVAWGDGSVTTECLSPFSPIFQDFCQSCLDNPYSEEPTGHNLAWLIAQVKQKEK